CGRLHGRRVLSGVGRNVPGLPCKIAADGGPAMRTVCGLPDSRSRVVKNVGVLGRPDDGLGANRARRWRGVRSSMTGSRRGDVGALRRDSVIDRYLSSVNHVRILRVGRRFAVLFDVDRMPIVERDFAVHTAAGNTSRTGVLLAAT